MNKAFFLANLLILALVACKNDPKGAESNSAPSHIQPGETANPRVLAGFWINLDFCAFANQYGSVMQAINSGHVPYAYAIAFNPAKPDSAFCSNAYETWSVPIHYNADTLELVGARQGKSIYLVYHSNLEKDITMIDATGPHVQMDHYIKSKAGTIDGYSAFTTALNHHLFNGVFTPLGKSASSDKVTFTPGGFLQGLKGYDRYAVCTGGDCFVAGQDIDVVTFFDSKNQEKSSKMFGYRYNGQNDTLTIFNLVNANKDIKGGYKVATPAYKFARKKSM